MTSNGTGDGVDGVRLGRELSAAVVLLHQAIAARLGLGAADHKAFDVLDRSGPLAPSELATRLGLTRAAVTAMLDRLERAGHVRRSPDRADRRRITVQLVEHQDPVIAEAFASLGDAMTAVLSRYSPRQQAAILSFLSATTEALGTATQQLSDAPPRRPKASRTGR